MIMIKVTPDSAGIETASLLTKIVVDKRIKVTPDSAGIETGTGARHEGHQEIKVTPDSAGIETGRRRRENCGCGDQSDP